MTDTHDFPPLAVSGVGILGFFEWDAVTGSLRSSPLHSLMLERAFPSGLPAEELERLAAVRARLSPSSPTYTHLLRYSMKGWGVSPLEEQGWGTFDEAGKLLRINGALRETGRGWLADSLRFLRTVIDATPSMIFVKDAQGRFILCNEALAQCYGASIEEILGHTDADFNGDAAEVAGFLDDDRAVIESRRSKVIPEEKVTFANGESHWFSTVKIPLVEANGVCDKVLAVATDITAYKHSEMAAEAARRALERERNLLRSVMNGTRNTHLVYLDRDFNFVRVNETYARTCGYSPEEMIGKNHFALYPHDENEMIFKRVRDTGEAAEFHDKPFVFPDQPERGVTYWDWSLTPVMEEAGEVTGLVFSLVETTGRKRTEIALRENQEELKRAQAVGRIGSWRMDAQRNALCWSDENYRIFGTPPGTPLTYETFLAAVHPDDRERVDQAWRAALRGEAYDIEHRLARDEKIWVHEKAELEFDENGNVLGGFGTTQDVTEHKLAEQVRQKFEALVEHSPDFIGMADLDGRSTYINPAGCAMLGLSWPEGVAGLHMTDCLPEYLLDFYRKEVIPAILTKGYWAGENVFRHFVTGEALPMGKISFLVRQPNGDPMCIATIARNIGPLKQAEKALREADRRKDEFLAMLAHELRNPLAPIRNATHVLGHLGLKEPKLAWAREVIEGQVEHLTRLVDDLLDVSRIVRGKIALKTERIELAALVTRALETMRPMMEGRRHRVTVRLPDGPVWLDADPVRLSQVLLNLLDNAAKYTPDGGQIELDARVADNAIEISVRDNGAGIPADLLPHVFELFQQGERTLDRAQGGLGLGLTLARQLAEMHGGSLQAASGGAGQGAVFTLRLPLAATALAGDGEAASGAKASPPGVRVLVVDDDLAVADSTAVLLELDGHDVRVAHDGESALLQAVDFKPGVVLLDIGLAGMDGFETAARLRLLPEGRDVRLLAVTGYGDESTRLRAEAAGCDRLLVKPVDVQLLADLVAEAGRA